MSSLLSPPPLNHPHNHPGLSSDSPSISRTSSMRSSQTIGNSGVGTTITTHSLLFPPNPAMSDNAPTGGILINKRRPSDATLSPVESVGFHPASAGPSTYMTIPENPKLGNEGASSSASGSVSVGQGNSSETATGSVQASSKALSEGWSPNPTRPGAGPTPHIRFAPLPDPRRQRSLSTGRNLAVAGRRADGTAKLTRETKYDEPFWYQSAVADDDDDDEGQVEERESMNEGEKKARPPRRESGDGSGAEGEDDDEDEDSDERTRSSKKWTMGMDKGWTMGMGSYTKKFFLKPLISPTAETYTFLDVHHHNGRGRSRSPARTEEDPELVGGQPLKKSVSTGGLIASSPFRTSQEHDRRRSFLLPAASALSIRSSKEKGHHHRGQSQSSFDRPDFSSLSSSLGREADYIPDRVANANTSPTRPVRMLNGRVYGAKRAAAAKQVKQTYEPEFDEWSGIMGDKGSRGLGSNSTARRISLDDDTARHGRNGFLEDEDDGSGMAWLKKRREARRREEEEAAKRAIMQSSDGVNEINTSSNPPGAIAVPLQPGIEVGAITNQRGTINTSSQQPAESEMGESVPGRSPSPPSSASLEEEEEDSDGENDFEEDDEEELEREEEAQRFNRQTSSAAGVEIVSLHKD